MGLTSVTLVLHMLGTEWLDKFEYAACRTPTPYRQLKYHARRVLMLCD